MSSIKLFISVYLQDTFLLANVAGIVNLGNKFCDMKKFELALRCYTEAMVFILI